MDLATLATLNMAVEAIGLDESSLAMVLQTITRVATGELPTIVLPKHEEAEAA